MTRADLTASSRQPRDQRNWLNRWGALALGLLLPLVLWLFVAPAALANTDHPFEKDFEVGPGCRAANIDVQEAEGIVYVLCQRNFVSGGEYASIRKFDLSGNPLPFSANEPYVSGNAITGTPDPAIQIETNPGALGNPYEIAVDNSNGPNKGDIFVANTQGTILGTAVDIFSPSGAWIGSIPFNGATAQGIDIDEAGNIYIGTSSGVNPGIRKFDSSFHWIEDIWSQVLLQTYGFDAEGDAWSNLALDNTGAVYAELGNYYNRYGVYKFESNAFSPKLRRGELAEEEEESTPTSPYAPSPFIPMNGPYVATNAFAVDPTTNEFYSDEFDHITVHDGGSPAEQGHILSAPFGEGHLHNSEGIAVTGDGVVYASTEDTTTHEFEVAVFEPGNTLPRAHTHAPRIPDVGHNTATVTGQIDPAGGAPVTECELEWGPTNVAGYSETPVPCSPDPSGTPFAEPTDVSATLPPTLALNKKYRYRFRGTNSHGFGWGAEQVVSPVAVLDVEAEPATNIEPHAARLHGTLDPDSRPTTYYFEYGLTSEYHQKTGEFSAGSGSGATPLEVPVSSLQENRTYHFALVAENSLGKTVGPDMTFTTAGRPEIGSLEATDLTTEGATLNAHINPAGSDTSYRFEYGTTPNYGAVVPVPDESIGAGDNMVQVSNALEHLQPGVTYHYRVVATNHWGTSTSDDTTLDFAPPSCPNAHVREQTSAAFLPDCRAYELVSPEDAGTAQIFPSQEILDFGSRGFGIPEYYDAAQWVQNTGEATNPPRFAFIGGLGAIPGLNAPNSLMDVYVSTRTSTGWTTTLPGLTGSEALSAERSECSADLSLCLDHHGRNFFSTNEEGSEENAPYLFTASGKNLGQLPSDVQVVPGGTKFEGDQQSSSDFSKFVFSSKNVAFAPGGLTQSPGSVYLNDRAAHTIKIISKLEGGEDIPHGDGGTLGENEVIAIPPGGVSADGSRVVMSTLAKRGELHLYLYAHGATKSLIGEHTGRFAGMTKSGSLIYVTSHEQLTGEDHDSSVDLYVWEDATEELKLASTGDGNGNTDECNAGWTTKCSIEILQTERGDRHGFGRPEWAPSLALPGIDSKLASEAGDIYYYSPEELDPNSPAAFGERNLYVYREGRNQLVATLDPGTSISRIQISPNGEHAAFITASKLTGYDNAGYREMYTYDAVTGKIRCASCNPMQSTPTASVIGSQGGPFMSNDGRAFFATREALVPQDTDGIVDVYEFVDGRPQLITTGTQIRDYNAPRITQIFFVAEHTGLESVSADGKDVYFTTYDSLVPQDRNGAFVKVYDARTDGGFEPAPPLAPCAAADECHGEGSSSVQTPQLPSATSLGGGGNVSPQPKHAQKHRMHRHRRHKHRRHKRPIGARGTPHGRGYRRG